MITKLLFKVMSIVVVMMLMGSYMTYMRTGKLPGFLTGDLVMPNLANPLDELPDSVQQAIEDTAGTAAEKVGKKTPKGDIVYKWQDESGAWHYTNTPPVDGLQSERMVMNTNRNVMKSTEVPQPEEFFVEDEESEDGELTDSASSKKKKTAKKKSSKNKTPKSGKDVLDIDPYSADGINELLESAQGLQETLNQRFEQQGQSSSR